MSYFVYGYSVEIDAGEGFEQAAWFDDNETPQLTPGGQHRTAMRIARKARSAGKNARVIGHFGGLGTAVQIDDPYEDYAPRMADYESSFPMD